MSMHERTLAVIQEFYDAAMDETLWPAALKSLASLTGSQAASFWVLDGSENPRLPTFICVNFDMRCIEEYLKETAALDPTVQYLVAHPNQPIVHDGLVISESEKDKHPYYDWHNRNIDTRFRMVGQTRVKSAVQAGVALHRTRKAGRYEPKDIQRFGVLHGHLERALAIGFRIGSLGTMQQVTTDWLDQNPAAVLFLDERKRIVFANRAARLFESEADGIRFAGDGITLLHKRDNEKLDSLLGQVIAQVSAAPGSTGSANASAGIGDDSNPSGMMRALRPSGKRPYMIHVSPVSGRRPVMSFSRPAVCVVITDPERHAKLPANRLQVAFGLTEAEARLAALLAEGDEVRTAAGKLGITYGTARTRLAEIFQKTETKRQGDLIRLLLTTLASA